MTSNTFGGLGLIEPLQRAVAAAKFLTPTPIQAQAIPLLLEGHDLLGCAQTGSGKTAAFGLPILQHIARNPRPAVSRSTRSLILAPTRELALQIAESIGELARPLRARIAVVFGGVNKRPQIMQLSRGVDILVATPGRLLDLMGEGYVRLSEVEIVVLDEADRMLDMGFIPDVERILARLPQKRQSLFFSATMPPDVARLARQMLHDPRQVEIERTVETMPKIEQRVMFVAREDKRALLADLLEGPEVSRALVFTRTKHRARDLARHLLKAGVRADAIHGDRSQSQRQRALDAFHEGSIRVLVATDIAARGLDVDDIDHVINYELPDEPESYVHRIGRTARAGKAGIALSLCDATEVEALRDIEKITQKLPVTDGHRYHDPSVAAAREALDQRRGGGRPPGARPAPRAQQAAAGRGPARGPAGRVPRSGTWGGRGFSRGRR
jgi:ATP-dependent RNA helicase RhlE